MSQWDGIVIGAGHNGLTCAAYLARAGLKIAVVERNDSIGGGTSTAEVTLPGFKHNLHANYFIGFDISPVYRDLELDRFGFRFLTPDVQHAWLFRDGRALVIHQDPEATFESFAQFSKRDALTFQDLYNRYAGKMRPLFASMLYNPPLAPALLRELLRGPEAEELLSYAPLSLYEAVNRHFEDEHIKVLFKTYMHVITAENVPGVGSFFPLIIANCTKMTLPVGGAVSLPRALTHIVEASGGQVLTGRTVEQILLRGGEARGVELDDGTTLEASRFVAGAIDFPQTVRLAGPEHFGDGIRAKAEGWKWSGHSLVTLHLALNEPPRFRAAATDPSVNQAYNFFFGADDSAELEQTFRDIEQQRFPSLPVGNGCCNSLFDPSYAPPGKHVAFWWPFAGYEIEGSPETWDTRRQEYTERLLEVWRSYAPNLTPDNVLATYLFTPYDIPKRNLNMVRGSVRVGAYTPDQLGINRPHPELSSYRTPIGGLYLCGSSTASGGGVNCAPGYNAAGAIAADLKLNRWWPEMPQPAWG